MYKQIIFIRKKFSQYHTEKKNEMGLDFVFRKILEFSLNFPEAVASSLRRIVIVCFVYFVGS